MSSPGGWKTHGTSSTRLAMVGNSDYHPDREERAGHAVSNIGWLSFGRGI